MNTGGDDFQARVLGMLRTHGDRVYRMARRYARTRDDADDLAQEVWTRVMEILPSKRDDAPEAAWLTLVAANVGREWRRSRYRWSEAREKALRWFGIERETQPRRDGPDLRSPGMQRIWDEIDGLPELQRAVVILRVYEDMSTRETAHAIDRAEGTVKASLHRGLASLRERLGDLQALWEEGDL